MANLKPCPSCNRIPQIGTGYIGIEQVWWVELCDCFDKDFNYTKKEDAIEAWNRRADPTGEDV